MSFESRCPQCVFVSRQIGQSTPCLLHVAPEVDLAQDSAASSDYDEPFEFGQVRPTVDRPGPFTVRQYVRLALLRSRLQEERRSSSTADAPMLVRGT